MSRKFSDQEKIRRATLDKLIKEDKNPYQVESVKRSCTLNEFIEKYNQYSKEELHQKFAKKKIILAGRIIAIRQTFAHIKDFSNKLQIYIDKKAMPNVFLDFKNIDIGDIVEVHGYPMKTMTGEITLHVSFIKIIAKALKVLPEKFHGLQDEELRARHRYVDLIVNDASMQTFIMRSKIITLIRKFMDEQGFIEVETPILQPVLGGAAARPFTTHHNALDRNFYLRIATELPLKKLVVGGFEKVYEIGRIFRNEGMDATHNPEFTSLESYAAYESLDETIDFVENIFKYLVKALKIKKLNFRGFEIDLSKPFKRIHMVDFIKEVTKIDFYKIKDVKIALDLAKKHHINVEKHQESIGHIINLFYEHFCEEKCIQPTFVYGHPVEISPLAKIDYADKRFTKRAELFIGQKEFSNIFGELNDPIDQYYRFEDQLKQKALGNDEANEMDLDFVEALEYGMPPTGGMGLGIDRIVMLFSGNETIRNVLLFPHMKDKV